MVNCVLQTHFMENVVLFMRHFAIDDFILC